MLAQGIVIKPLTLGQIRIVLSISWNYFSAITMPVILSANPSWTTANFVTIRWHKSFQWVTYHCYEFIIWQIRQYSTYKRFLDEIFDFFFSKWAISGLNFKGDCLQNLDSLNQSYEHDAFPGWRATFLLLYGFESFHGQYKSHSWPIE